MNILWFTWKDLRHPLAGGAERVNEELAKRLARDGHHITLLTSRFDGSEEKEIRDGYEIIRMGNRYTVYWKAYQYYKKHFLNKEWDIVIDEMNTIPFFAKLYVKQKNILLSYQLCREVWFYQMAFPLNIVGYLLEPIYLYLLRDRIVLTESMSTKKDMMKYGFKEDSIFVFNIGFEFEHIESLESIKKYENPTIVSLGSIRAMKRTLHIVKAFELARKEIKDLKLIIAGDSDSDYGTKVLAYIENSPFKEDITYLGRVDAEKKREIMQKSHLIAVTSVKEGWGLIVTEANSQGTPAVVYDVDGLRDSVIDGETGLVCEKNKPFYLGKSIVSLLSDKKRYIRFQQEAYSFSKKFTQENAYAIFLKILNNIIIK